jgi:hypothetical protein
MKHLVTLCDIHDKSLTQAGGLNNVNTYKHNINVSASTVPPDYFAACYEETIKE